MVSHLRDSNPQLPNSWLLPECDNRVPIILRPKKKKGTRGCRQMHREEFHGWYFSSIFLRWINQGWDGLDMQETWWRSEMHTKFWSVNLKGRHYLGETGVNGRILKWVGVKEDDVVNWFHTAQDISVISGTKSVAALFKQSLEHCCYYVTPQDIPVI